MKVLKIVLMVFVSVTLLSAVLIWRAYRAAHDQLFGPNVESSTDLKGTDPISQNHGGSGFSAPSPNNLSR